MKHNRIFPIFPTYPILPRFPRFPTHPQKSSGSIVNGEAVEIFNE